MLFKYFEIIGLSMLALTLAGLAAVFLIVVYHKGKKKSYCHLFHSFFSTLDSGFVIALKKDGAKWH